MTFNGTAKRRPGRSRIADFGDRMAKTFNPSAEDGWETDHGTDEFEAGTEVPEWDSVLPRFPITRQGYDCATVDQHIAALERELDELDRELAVLRARPTAEEEVAAEIQRIGEQTSAILVAAHDEARETSRLARVQAERCIGDARCKADAITDEATRKLRSLEGETHALRRERERLIEDTRTVAAALFSVAEAATERVAEAPQLPDRGAEVVGPAEPAATGED